MNTRPSHWPMTIARFAAACLWAWAATWEQPWPTVVLIALIFDHFGEAAARNIREGR